MSANDNSSEFEARIKSVVNSGFLNMGLAIGMEQGFFKALDKLDKPVTASELAAETGCKERYCYEWLSMMGTGRILDMDEAGQTFYFPPSHRSALTGPKFAMLADIPLLAQAHNPLMKAFKQDGPRGLNCEEISPFFNSFKRNRPGHIAHTVPLLIQQVDGLDEKLKSGITVCDIGASQGTLLFCVAKMYPNSTFYGLDIAEEDILEAQAISKKENITNVTFQQGDAGNLPEEWKDKFDLVFFFHTLHHLPCAAKAAIESRKVLKPGGILSVYETNLHSNPRDNIDNPSISMFYTYSMYYCLSASMYTEGSDALGPCAGVEKLESLLKDAGYDMENAYKKYKADANNDHMVVTK